MAAFDDLLADRASRERLRALVETGIAGHLVVIEGPGDLPVRAGNMVGAALLSPAALPVDLRSVAPATGRWTIAELDETVISAANLAPDQRSIVIVDAADRMDDTAADHLLKTLEEPPNGALFVFCVPDAGGLSSTIQSRVTATVHLDPLSAADVVARMTADGVERTAAEELVALCGPWTSLAEAAGGDDALRDTIRAALGVTLAETTAAPATTAAALADGLEALAKAQMGRGAKVAAVRARARELSRVLTGRWRAEVAAALRAQKVPARRCARIAEVLDDLDAAVAMNASLPAALTGALVIVATRR